MVDRAASGSDETDDVRRVVARSGAECCLSGNSHRDNLGRLSGTDPNTFAHPREGCSIGWAEVEEGIAVAAG